MADKVSGAFISGANARVKLNNQTLAYCTDVSYSVTVQTIPVEAMASYEVHSNEPVAYTVDGSFSVIRYTKNLGATTSNPTPDAALVDGNKAKAMVFGNQLDPAQILTSRTFDLEVHVKSASADGTAEQIAVYKLQDCRVVRRAAALNKRGILVDQYQFVAVLAGDWNGNTMDASDSTFKDLS